MVLIGRLTKDAVSAYTDMQGKPGGHSIAMLIPLKVHQQMKSDSVKVEQAKKEVLEDLPC
ncbi:MAG: hypothetical protein IPP72_07005 [Chitinophagaceae bacterium]|nr:hypothetical protein [Chitinophagaceae bacterium]